MPRKSIEKLLSILESVAEGIYCVDLSGNCTYCNSRCVEMLGFDSDQELLGQNMHDLIHHHKRDGSDYPVETSKIYQAYHDGRHLNVQDEVFFRKDGTRFDAEYRSYPLREGDEIVGAVVTFSDISLRRAEASHRLHLSRLVESSQDAILGRDLDGKITSWNEGATKIFGYQAEEVLGRTISEIILPADRQREEPEIRQAINDGVELNQFEVKRRRENGEVIDISLTISPIFNADDELVGFSSIERDITETRKSQDAILRAMTTAEHAKQLANKANKSRADFLANVSHELRTPMNAILGMINLSLEEDLDPTVADYMTVAKTSADSLLELVNELLDFAKIESGNFEISNQEFNLREIVDQSGRTLAARASEKGLEILCEIDNEVPARVIGDGRRIQQVLTNLLSNACKFTEKGEIVVRVELVRQLLSESRLRFSVQDTGIGIAEEDQKNILLPFQQADMSSTRQQHGTGLGLSICRELVSLMGGKLQLKSQLDVGSTFSFSLSLPVADRSTPADKLPSELVKDLKVLIVDDNPTNLRILEKTFVSWSMQPIVTGDAERALRVVDQMDRKNKEISVILVDCLMPQTDGFELAEKLNDTKGDDCPPIVMMQSASDLSLYADRKASAPVTQYLTKPVSQSELLDTVVGVLDLYSDETNNGFMVEEVAEETSLSIRPLQILLVEDLPANQKVAKTILEKRGHRVTTATNGRNAIDQLANSDQLFDVVLMDVQMPVMDGLQATAAIRAMDSSVSSVPIIAMTAHAMQGDRESCLAAGMDAYLSKPLDSKQLVELTESIVESPCADASDPRKTVDQTFQNTEAEVMQSSKQNEPELVDLAAAMKRLGNDKELFDEFADIFLCDAPGIFEQLEYSIEQGDCEQLEKSAHALKGMMSNFGAKPCCDLALAFEVAGRNGNIDAVKNDLTKLNNLYNQLCNELEAYLKS
jgi:PAS domain S-box-containing protein